MHPEPLDLERLGRLKFSSRAYTFQISHNALDYRYLIANEIIAKERKERREKQIILKLGLEGDWEGGGGHFKYCYCQLPRVYNFYIKLPWGSKVCMISTLF